MRNYFFTFISKKNMKMIYYFEKVLKIIKKKYILYQAFTKNTGISPFLLLKMIQTFELNIKQQKCLVNKTIIKSGQII